MSQPERDQLAGMPPLLMMQLQARLEARLGDCCAFEADRKELARWMLHRLMETRMNDGRQFDSILAASQKAFAEQMLAAGLKAR